MPDLLTAIDTVLDIAEPGGKLYAELHTLRAKVQRELETDNAIGTYLVRELADNHELMGTDFGIPPFIDATTIGRLARQAVDTAREPKAEVARDARPT